MAAATAMGVDGAGRGRGWGAGAAAAGCSGAFPCVEVMLMAGKMPRGVGIRKQYRAAVIGFH